MLELIARYQVQLFGVDLPEARFHSREGALAYAAALRSPSAKVWDRNNGANVEPPSPTTSPSRSARVTRAT